MADIPFGEFMPDRPDAQNGANEAKNVIPVADGYRPLKAATSYGSNGLGARVQGAVSAQDATGIAYNYAGDVSALYALQSATWTDISSTAGYATDQSDHWEFAKFGDRIIATNYTNPIQSLLMGGAQFLDIGGSSIPKCRHVGVVGNFLVLGNTSDQVDGLVPNRVWWSGLDNPTDFPTPGTDSAIAVQSSYNDLVGEGGWVQRIVGGQYGLVFQEKEIHRMTYVGPPLIFQFDSFEQRRGTPAPGSVVAMGRDVYYLGQDGFYVCNGIQSEPIGAEKVDRYFFDDMDPNYYDRIHGMLDPYNKIVMWVYPGSGSVSGACNKALLYHWLLKRWSYAEFASEYVYWSLGEGYTLEGLDAVSASLDALPASLDSRVWAGGSLYFSIFGASHQLQLFTGTEMNSTLDTKEFQLWDGYRADVDLIRPVMENMTGTMTAQVGSRESSFDDSVTWSAAIANDADGNIPVRANGRLMRIRINTTGGYKSASGAKVLEAAKAGKR